MLGRISPLASLRHCDFVGRVGVLDPYRPLKYCTLQNTVQYIHFTCLQCTHSEWDQDKTGQLLDSAVSSEHFYTKKHEEEKLETKKATKIKLNVYLFYNLIL